MPHVLSIVGKSDTGKTTLMEGLIRALTARGVRVGTIKHDVHGFEMDREGKDSWRHKQAGAVTTLVSSPTRIGMVREVDHDHPVEELVRQYLGHVDLVLVEGHKRQPLPKIEVHRAALARPLLSTPEEGLIAVATDEPLPVDLPHFGLDEVEAMADFVIAWMSRS
jgi:molybdopterin-guanine dinucleotide biosynthesis adapter protein